MSLTLTIENVDRLDNGESTQLRLDRHGAIIGRSPHSDWSLPDPKNYISSTHCEIDYRDGAYVLIDKSTNGTFVNDAPERLPAPHVLADGDVIVIGHYRVVARTAEGARAPAPAAPATGGWSGWDSHGEAPAPPAAPASRWDEPAPAPAPPAPPPASGGWGSAPEPAPSPAPGWGAPDPAPTPAPGWGAAPAADAGWGSAPAAGSSPAAADPWGAPSAHQPVASGWDPLSTPTPQTPADAWAAAPASAISGRGPMAQNWTAPKVEAPPPDPEDVWSRFSSSHAVDWARGGFGEPEPAPAPLPAAPPAAAPAPTIAPQGDAAWNAFLAAAGLTPDAIKSSPVEAAAAAGGLLKRLVSGLVVMMEARARAKAQLGAQSTTLELAGNNPLKFARSPDKVMAQMINPPERGFMEAGQAVEDSFHDLQAHQMATLAAMQGALRSTLERFSPEAIRQRAETRGLLAKIIPSARNAALWDAYQREFEGVARGSDEAFLDVFAKAFRAAYEKASAEMKHGGR